MSQIQTSASMPKEWYDQLHELAYGQPADTRPAKSEQGKTEDADALKWNSAAAPHGDRTAA